MNEERPAASEPSAGGREPKVIKRYTNRKLYDTVESRYVTLDEIAQMIKAGAEVQIIDNRTKEDLTSITLAQIIFEEEKKTSKMSLDTLRDLIRHGGEVAQRLVEGTQAELRGKFLDDRRRLRPPGNRREPRRLIHGDDVIVIDEQFEHGWVSVRATRCSPPCSPSRRDSSSSSSTSTAS